MIQEKKLYRHVIIAGTPRAGKTPVCSELLKYGFTHYKMDSIKRGICDAFGYDQHDWNFLNEKIAKVIKTIILENSSDTVAGLEYYAIDTCHILPKDISLFNNDVLVVYLGYADIDVEEKVKEIRLNDKGHYWSSKVSDDVLRRMINANVNLSKEIREDCKRYN
ncbi:MAG: hypothetical protein K2H20_04855, partial [Bacilli bacterium]|nr:hypothetical protein [Bacilli bacterium]